MKALFIDIETYSPVDLIKSGVYVYAQHPDFRVILFGYSADGEPVKVVDVQSGETILPEVLAALSDTEVIKWAHNVNFERVCLTQFVGKRLLPTNWRCSMILSAYCGFPLTLEKSGAVLNVELPKLAVGKKLIQMFCKPDPQGERPIPSEFSRLDWEMFKEYNARDVETEMCIINKLGADCVPNSVWREFELDNDINDCGVLIDKTLAEMAIEFDERATAELKTQMRELTQVDNPNSTTQLKQWLSNNGVETDKLGKSDVKEMLVGAPSKLTAALELRLQLCQTSVKKYASMLVGIDFTNRARGLFQFYAAHSGREGGRRIQLQNLPRGDLHGAELSNARTLVKRGDYESVKAIYDDVLGVLSSLVRSALIPRFGRKFIVADFSAIECRVLAWLAGEQWVLDSFVAGHDIYKVTAAQMYKVDYDYITKEQRQRGKVAVLAGGYGGGIGAFKAFGADKMGMSDTEINGIIQGYRNSNPKIVKMWYELETAVKSTIESGFTTKCSCFTIRKERNALTIELPSGRKLYYQNPRMTTNRFGKEGIVYTGVGAVSKKWEDIETYGGRLVENVTQSVARDLLFYSMQTLADHKIQIVAHVHDEVICEVEPSITVEEICELMGRTPVWAVGLPLKAEGYECEYYEKQ
jgi:DNA polymerase